MPQIFGNWFNSFITSFSINFSLVPCSKVLCFNANIKHKMGLCGFDTILRFYAFNKWQTSKNHKSLERKRYIKICGKNKKINKKQTKIKK